MKKLYLLLIILILLMVEVNLYNYNGFDFNSNKIEFNGTKFNLPENFNVANESENTIRIIHSQEVPEYKKIWIFEASEPCNEEKIFVIDDWSHATMLLAKEY